MSRTSTTLAPVKVRLWFTPITPTLRTTYRNLRKTFERRDVNLICFGIAMVQIATGDKSTVVTVDRVTGKPA